MDVQVSHARILIGDNVAPFTYSDAQIRSAVNLGPPPALPSDVVICGFLTFMTWPFPVGS